MTRGAIRKRLAVQRYYSDHDRPNKPRNTKKLLLLFAAIALVGLTYAYRHAIRAKIDDLAEWFVGISGVDITTKSPANRSTENPLSTRLSQSAILILVALAIFIMVVVYIWVANKNKERDVSRDNIDEEINRLLGRLEDKDNQNNMKEFKSDNVENNIETTIEDTIENLNKLKEKLKEKDALKATDIREAQDYLDTHVYQRLGGHFVQNPDFGIGNIRNEERQGLKNYWNGRKITL